VPRLRLEVSIDLVDVAAPQRFMSIPAFGHDRCELGVDDNSLSRCAMIEDYISTHRGQDLVYALGLLFDLPSQCGSTPLQPATWKRRGWPLGRPRGKRKEPAAVVGVSVIAGGDAKPAAEPTAAERRKARQVKENERRKAARAARQAKAGNGANGAAGNGKANGASAANGSTTITPAPIAREDGRERPAPCLDAGAQDTMAGRRPRTRYQRGPGARRLPPQGRTARDRR
jgi:hypothetical protein